MRVIEVCLKSLLLCFIFLTWKILKTLWTIFLTPTLYILVYGKPTDEWHTDEIRVHTSDIRITHEYIRLTYGWRTSTYEWHMNDIGVHTSDKQMTCEYIRVAYGWHTSTYERHTNDIWVHTSDIQTTRGPKEKYS